MGWLRDAGLTTKLTFAFLFCALMTLLAVMVGGHGMNEVSRHFKRVLTNNEMSDVNDDVRTSIAEQNRDLYRLLASSIVGGSNAEGAEIIQSIKTNRSLGKTAVILHRENSLLEDNRSVGDLNAKDWLAYQESVDRFISLLETRDVEGARRLMASEVQPSYLRVIDELKIIRRSNSDQLSENIMDGNELVHHNLRVLGIITVLAFMAALAFGVILARLINLPLAMAIRAVQRIESGDLSVPIISTRHDELGQLLLAMNLMQTRLNDDIQQIVMTSDQIFYAANKVAGQVRAVQVASSRGDNAKSS
ncbi:methyl-accepting chemotaxis protein [Pseudomonas fluorescens]|uniref:HAMP domain-containing protein n=1 Tax=Pseudomonas fluorescens TaxID=294 RepID=A0A423LKD6_PSEFL|nr:methyl-accepting chemotaxis protein [Pseudomonas fluorescens]RON68792.1 hypothetical protein BK671_10645 [Pseudomonas fluorescens]